MTPPVSPRDSVPEPVLEEKKSAIEVENAPSKWKIYAWKTWEVTKQIFLALLGGALCVVNPTVFVISFVAGIAFDESVQKIIDKVAVIWESYKWGILAGIGLFALTGVVSILSLHVVAAAATAFYAINLGCKLSLRAEMIRRGEETGSFSFV